MNFKTLTIEELAKDYGDRHGFIFMANEPSSDEAIQRVCDKLVDFGITSLMPEFVVRIGNYTAYVYDNEDFDGPTFFFEANKVNKMGFCGVHPLSLWLKQESQPTPAT